MTSFHNFKQHVFESFQKVLGAPTITSLFEIFTRFADHVVECHVAFSESFIRVTELESDYEIKLNTADFTEKAYMQAFRMIDAYLRSNDLKHRKILLVSGLSLLL